MEIDRKGGGEPATGSAAAVVASPQLMQPTGPVAPIGALLAAAESRGGAAQQALFEALYAELHRLAESHVLRAGRHVTLGTTTLLHEAYLEISKRDALAFSDRGHFFA